jgi:hypothetical protein
MTLSIRTHPDLLLLLAQLIPFHSLVADLFLAK